MLTLFNISHFSSTTCIAAMAKTSSTRIRKRTCHSQITTYDEFDRKKVFVRFFSASSNPGRTSHGHQDPERSVPIDDRTGQPVETSRSDYFQKDYGLSWFSQEWKSGAGEQVKYKFIKTTFIKKKFSSKSTFIKIHFHQKPLSSKTNFIKKPLSSKCHFHQKPLSSKTIFIKNHFHQ